MTIKDYDSWDKARLVVEIKKLSTRKKYGLVWEDKPEAVVEKCRTELPVLEEVSDRALEADISLPINYIIEGDNYHALSVLNYTHSGKVDVIYIDPPYNTGARDWRYDNNYVDSEDAYRHTKWIAFMEHRLKLAKQLLSPVGIICVTIDDYELPRLWLLMDEVFGERNFLGNVAIRINPGGRKSKRKVAAQHEYALFYSENSGVSVAKIPIKLSDKTHSYKEDSSGWYEERNLRKDGADSLAKPDSKRFYPVYFNPKTGQISANKKLPIEILPLDIKGQKRIWRRGEDVIDEMYKNGDLFTKETKYGLQVYYKFRGGLNGETPKSFWDDSKYSASEHGTQTLNKILGKREVFNYPKSPHATRDCIQVASNKRDAVILDFFAGSGTTGQAVLELNKEDGGSRQFILCTNNENGIAEEVTYPRIKKVIEGYSDVEGMPANLRYFKTTFVRKSDVSDDTRRELIKKSTEMICLKESTFKKVYDNKKFKIYQNNSQSTGVLFDLDSIDEFKKRLEKIGLKTHIYVFSLTSDAFIEDFVDLETAHKIQPIPEGILEVYRKIFS